MPISPDLIMSAAKLGGKKGIPELTDTQASNISNTLGLATSVLDNIQPTRQNAAFSESKYGEGLLKNQAASSGLNQVANIGFNKTAIAATGGLSAVVGGAIKLGVLADKANTDAYGRKKSLGADALLRSAMPLANLRSGIKNLNNKDLSTKEKIMSFTPLAGKVQNKIANKQKDLFDRSQSMRQAQELKAQSNNIYGFKSGGRVGCGCDKESEGLDTDLFKTMQPRAYMEVQRHIGSDVDGIYKESDKMLMKHLAKRSGGTLRTYLESNPRVKLMIGLKEGGIISRVYKAGGKIKWV